MQGFIPICFIPPPASICKFCQICFQILLYGNTPISPLHSCRLASQGQNPKTHAPVSPLLRALQHLPVALRSISQLCLCWWNPFLTHPYLPFPTHCTPATHTSFLVPEHPKLLPASGPDTCSCLCLSAAPQLTTPRTSHYSALSSKSRFFSVGLPWLLPVLFISSTFALGRNLVFSFVHVYLLSPQLEVSSLKARLLLLFSILFIKCLLGTYHILVEWQYEWTFISEKTCFLLDVEDDILEYRFHVSQYPLGFSTSFLHMNLSLSYERIPLTFIKVRQVKALFLVRESRSTTLTKMSIALRCEKYFKILHLLFCGSMLCQNLFSE